MGLTFNNESGNIVIDNEVIAMIAGHVTVNSYGVVGMASKRVTEDWAELLGIENVTKGVAVEINQNRISISISVIVKYGVAIKTVAENIISAVRYNVEKLTGMKVASIKFSVEGVRL